MPLKNFLYLVWVSIVERKGRMCGAVAVVAFTVAVVSSAFSFGFGFLRGAIVKAEELFPRGFLVVKPRAVDIMMFRFSAGGITDDKVQAIRQLEGVSSVARQISLKMPLRAEGEIVGQQVTTDAVVVGIDEEMVAGDVRAPFTFRFDAATSLPIPCVVPRFFLDMYNMAYADSMGLPKINEGFAMGKEFSLVLGETYLLGSESGNVNRRAEMPCRVVGLSNNPLLFTGVFIPLGHAKALNRWYRGARAGAEAYTALYVRVGDLAKLDDVTSAIQSMGFVVESQRETVEKFVFVAKAAGVGIVVFTAITLAIGALSILHTFTLILYQRRAELGLMRAVGATHRQLVGLLLGEALGIGAFGSLGGVAFVFFAANRAQRLLQETLPAVSFLPSQVFLLDWWLALAAVATGCALCAVAMLPMLLHVRSAPPAALLEMKP